MKIALVGNQNCGKTFLFNVLTGANQKIGNWPGVTIERKSGVIKGTNHELVDLPGIYSMSPYSEEEKISRDFILSNEADLIINVIDATCIERSLYLTTQLLETDNKVVVALNMCDLLEKKGIKIDEEKLSKELNVKVVKVSALKGTGIDKLKEAIDSEIPVSTHCTFDDKIEKNISLISKLFDNNKRFYSVKVIEGECTNENINLDKLKSEYKYCIDEVIADQRYKYISEIKEKCVNIDNKKESINDKLDKIFLNKWLALPIFALIMFFVYYLSVGVVGSFTVDLVDSFFGLLGEKLAELLGEIGASSWLISLICDGIVAGVGAVLNFVPQLCILFLCISILETTGYMSRISFFLDMVFKKFGLSGKSLIPFIVGSGCSVPGVMSSRIVENKDEREMTIMLTPFIPCSAKLPIIALFAGYFFKSNSGLVSASLYFLAILTILILALLLKKFIYKNESSSFISELPEYKLPSAKYVLKDVFDKVLSFIKRAGSVILVSSVVIWFMLSFSFKLEYGVDVENSILAFVGKSLSWVFYPMLGNFSWQATVSAIQGLVAKEQVVSSMAIIANMSEDTLNTSALFSGTAFGFFSGVSAYAFVAFNLFSIPCFGACGAMKKELGSTKKVIFAMALQFVVAWLISSLIYLIGTLIVGG